MKVGKRREVSLVIVTYKKYGLFISEVWFPDSNWRQIKSDIVRLRCIEDNKILRTKEMRNATIQHSLYTDLTKSEEILYSEIKSKNFKYEIRRSERDNIEIRYLSAKEILQEEDLMSRFKKCYDKMFAQKGKNASMNLNAMRSYANENALLMSIAYLDGEPVVFHSYVRGDNRVRFFHSCSTFRSEPQLAQIIGRANKRLHWEDWKYLKERGVQLYDWGGVFAFDSEDGIDKFKMTFGGKPIDYYNATIPTSFAGKILLKIKKMRSVSKII